MGDLMSKNYKQTSVRYFFIQSDKSNLLYRKSFGKKI